jgi:Txe/YoeB family toxin of toxin-antitoxin system
MYRLVYTKQVQKDAKRLSSSNLREKAEEILETLKIDPFSEYPPYEKLMGELSGAISRRMTDAFLLNPRVV